MSDRVHVLTPRDPQWDSWLKLAPHDFYHLAAYHAFAESAGEGTPELVVYGNKNRFLAWPYLIREIDDDHLDATSVYGYTGPTGHGLEDDAFRADAWKAVKDAWAERRLVTVFTRFHPLLANEAYCTDFKGAAPTPGGEILHLGRSVSIDLADDRETRRAKYRQVLRQEIKRAEARGLSVDLDAEWHHYEKFVELYAATMQHNDASDRYLFHRDYFNNLVAALQDKVHLAVAHVDGEVAATMLFTVYNGIAQAHFAGVDRAHARLSPLKGLIDGVADIARDFGAAQFHIGAGRGGAEDSLYEFKSRFSRTHHNFRIGRWILDRETNEALIRRLPYGADPDFFPAYRSSAMPQSAAV